MSLFCLLWVPLFYLFRRSIVSAEGGGGVWALLLGSVTAIAQFFLGALIQPGGFGISRWLSGFVDIISMPVLIPLIVYLLFLAMRLIPTAADFANFALPWLIPTAVLRSVSWSALGYPVLLIVPPLLWTALAVGISFFIDCCIRHPRLLVIVPAVLCILVLPITAASSWWAFYSQKTVPGFVLLSINLLPMALSIVIDIVRMRKRALYKPEDNQYSFS